MSTTYAVDHFEILTPYELMWDSVLAQTFTLRPWSDGPGEEHQLTGKSIWEKCLDGKAEWGFATLKIDENVYSVDGNDFAKCLLETMVTAVVDDRREWEREQIERNGEKNVDGLWCPYGLDLALTRGLAGLYLLDQFTTDSHSYVQFFGWTRSEGGTLRVHRAYLFSYARYQQPDGRLEDYFACSKKKAVVAHDAYRDFFNSAAGAAWATKFALDAVQRWSGNQVDRDVAPELLPLGPQTVDTQLTVAALNRIARLLQHNQQEMTMLRDVAELLLGKLSTIVVLLVCVLLATAWVAFVR